MSTDETRGHYVKALVIESPTTPKQRARNYALYLRLRDGTPVEERSGTRDGVGLNVFGFEVPLASMSMGSSSTGEPSMSFRLDKNGECYRRLLSYISDHFPYSCDADDEVAALTAERDAAVADMEAAEQRMAGVLDGTFATKDETAAREIERLTAERDAMRAVVEAAKKWREGRDVSSEESARLYHARMIALFRAIDALAAGET